jgi:hypothetical protein
MVMSTEAMQAAIDRIEHDSEFARLVYEDSQTLPSRFDLTAEECAAVRDPLVSALDAYLGEVQGFVSFNFGRIEIVYTPQKPDGSLLRVMVTDIGPGSV